MRFGIVWVLIVGCFALSRGEAGAQTGVAAPLFRSEIVTVSTTGHSVTADVEIRGLKEIYLIVEDGGDGIGHDWASWAEPRLIGPQGELSLCELKPHVATAGYGSVQWNKNAGGEPIRISGRNFARGIGTHANSVIGFQLPDGYERLAVTAGLDEGGTSQADGHNASVRFVIQSSPPSTVTRSTDDRNPHRAVGNLDVAEGLQATLFAAEPDLFSLTNLDIDHRGRIWVCEVVNYRGHNGKRPEGDRIVICTDNDGDGLADEFKVYYQGPDVNSAMGICVLGNQVIVSCSPNIWLFTDEDGDDIPDRKELLFSNTGIAQHDHSAHSFVFGPDGKLYWNFGNTGHAVHDAAGKIVTDKRGREISDRGQPFRGGMVFRCNPDGSEMEVIGHNFRNNYEAAVDSFGTVWQSDNDDDGNRAVRINYVMEAGNYGYLDERTGAGWQSPRTAMESAIPDRHWHLDDPGVVPNLLVTGAGSPTGIVVYEGDLLPERFHNQIIHCDAGPSVVRSYPVNPDGAGYRVAAINDLVIGARDNWFRPADVAVAPDGSLFVTDWHDPGVGGHAMGDLERGRLFRIAPPGHSCRVPEFDFSRPESAIEALKNPCQSVRYLAWQALTQPGSDSVEALEQMALDPNPRYRARALWILSQLDGMLEPAVARASDDPNVGVQCQGVRMGRHQPALLGPMIRQLTPTAPMAVCRELALALRDYHENDFGELWTILANRHDGEDRWYLEALGIAADGRWDECLPSWMENSGDNRSQRVAVNIIWRSRSEKTAELIAGLLADPATDLATGLRLFRSLDFQNPERSNEAMRKLAMVFEKLAGENRMIPSAFLPEMAFRISGFETFEIPLVRSSLVSYLNESVDERTFVESARRLGFREFAPRLISTVLQTGDRNHSASATRTLFEIGESRQLVDRFAESPEVEQLKIVNGWNWSGTAEARQQLQAVISDDSGSTLVRCEAIKALGQWPEGQEFILELVVAGVLDDDLRFPSANVLLTSASSTIRAEAQKYLTLPVAAGNSPLPPLNELLRKRGDEGRGAAVFSGIGTCAKCHKVNGEGEEVGPDLSGIGGKLSAEAMYESILNPSAGISHGYEMYTVLKTDGTMISGLLLSRTDVGVVIKDKDAIVHRVPAGEIEDFRKQEKSLMPEELQKLMTEQELVDVVEYLKSLKAD